MLIKLTQAQKEWGGSLSVIDNWLAARQNLIVLYCELAGLPPYSKAANGLPSQKKITNFCQTLLDYASKGHFEVYEQLINQCNLDDQESLAQAEKLYSRITTATETSLCFNDKYAESASDTTMLDFDKDLSKLGEVIENRFNREDQLLTVLCTHNTLA